MSDVTSFRSYFGLPANNPTIIVNGTNPGIWNSDEETEADLDIEWSGAVAKNATVDFVVSQSTNSTDGVDLSAQYIVNHKTAPAMSTSFGECEQFEGSTGNTFFNNLWQQAASEGITAFISAGDSGAAGCDGGGESTAQYGLGVNALCSSPYDVCVGGTEFNDGSNPSLYWSSTNSSTNASALSYIPEVVWNESGSNGGSGLWAGGGGVSTVYSKPSWQTGTGVPNDGKRDVPDVSLTASGHDGYLIFQEGGMYVVGGTSASSPSFAGLMALVVQNANAWQGNANSTFYSLATKQASGGAAVFHDTTSGNNSVPGQTGYTAGVGYDQASGLGSVDASVMINHWSDASTVPSYHAALAASSVQVIPGSTATDTVTVTVSNGFKAAIALAITGLPTGVTGSFTPATLASPGSGPSTLKLNAASTAIPGSYSATITATSGSSSQQMPLSITVEATPTFSVGSSSSSVSIEAGGSSNTVTISATPNSTFNAAIAFTLTGLPAGVTGAFTPVTISAPGSGSTSLKLTAASTAKAGSATLTVTGTSGTLKKTVSVSLTVSPAPTFTLSPSATSVSVAPGKSNTLTFTTTPNSTFSAAIDLSVTGLPSGMSGQFSSSGVIASPGSGSSVLTLTAASTMAPKAYSITVSGTGGGVTQKQPITVNVPGLVLTAGATSVTVSSSTKGTVKITGAAEGGFSGAVAFSTSGLPTGISASFSPTSVAAPGNGSTTLTLTKGSGASTGTKTIQLTGTSGSVTQSANISITVK